MNIIIVGDGKVGYTLAQFLSKDGHDITIIDKNADALARAGGDVRPLTKALNAAFAGRGGGKPGLCQGSCAAGTAEDIAAWLAQQA